MTVKRREMLAMLAATSATTLGGFGLPRKPVLGQCANGVCTNGSCYPSYPASSYPTQPRYGYPRYPVQRATEDAYGQPLSKGYRYFTDSDGRLVNEKGVPYIDTTTGECIDAATGNRIPNSKPYPTTNETPREATQPPPQGKPSTQGDGSTTVATSSDTPQNPTDGTTPPDGENGTGGTGEPTGGTNGANETGSNGTSAESSAVVNSGWTPNPEATRAFIARTPPEYRQQIASLARDEDRSERLLYRYLTRLVVDAGLTEWFTQRDGHTVLCSYNQGSVGSCAGHATAAAVNVITACEIAMGGQPFEFRHMCSAEATYGIGRRVANMLGSGEGCYISAVVEGCETIGTLYCTKYANVDLTHYSENRCREFGKKGVGDVLEKAAAEHKTLAAVNIENFGELLAAIRNGYPAVFGSTVGYNGKRNEEGIIDASGTWNHALMGLAIRYSPKYGWLVGLQNSWSNAWNPTGYVADEPYGFWWAKQRDVERMLADRYGECFALSGIHGFRRQTLPDMGSFFGGR